MTHEMYIESIRGTVTLRLNDDESRHRLNRAKLVYGSGRPGVRGICFYEAWNNSESLELIEICAFGEESPLQLAGTTIHELAHCLAGHAAGHGQAWKSAARKLGLKLAMAAGQAYAAADFDPVLLRHIRNLSEPTDGRPVSSRHPPVVIGPRPCSQGHGTRGGKSRGPGSGSRLKLFICGCTPPVRIRVARDDGDFHALCLECGQDFRRQNAKP